MTSLFVATRNECRLTGKIPEVSANVQKDVCFAKRGERFEFGDKIQAERRDKVNKDQLDKIVADCQYRGNVPRCWLEVLKDELLASRTAHVHHDAGGFMYLMQYSYNHLPIRYTGMLHDIIWEQTKNYLAGGHRGLNGLSHPLSPQNNEWDE